jgi:hypothetical protein
MPLDDVGAIPGLRAVFTPTQLAEIHTFILENAPFKDHIRIHGKATATNLKSFDLSEIRPLLDCDGLEGRMNRHGVSVQPFLDDRIRGKLARDWASLYGSASATTSRAQSRGRSATPMESVEVNTGSYNS